MQIAILSSVASTGSQSFKGCLLLKEVTIPATVAFVISSLLAKEYNDKFLQKDKNYLKFYQDEIVKMEDVKLKEQKVKVFSECLLLSKIKSSMMHLVIICNLYIKNDAMRIVAQELHVYITLFLINNLTKFFSAINIITNS